MDGEILGALPDAFASPASLRVITAASFKAIDD